MQRLSMYIGLALVFGSTLSASSVLAVDAGDAKKRIPLLIRRLTGENNSFQKCQLVWKA